MKISVLLVFGMAIMLFFGTPCKAQTYQETVAWLASKINTGLVANIDPNNWDENAVSADSYGIHIIRTPTEKGRKELQSVGICTTIIPWSKIRSAELHEFDNIEEYQSWLTITTINQDIKFTHSADQNDKGSFNHIRLDYNKKFEDDITNRMRRAFANLIRINLANAPHETY